MKSHAKVGILAGLIAMALSVLPVAYGQYWTLDSGFTPALEADTLTSAYAIAYPGGRLLTGGVIINGKVVSGQMVRLKADGTIDAAFNPPFQSGAIAVYPDGSILSFTSIPGDVYSVLIQRLLTDGSADSSFTPITVEYESIHVLLLGDGRVLLFGAGITTGGSDGSYLMLLTASGAVDSTFVSPIPPNVFNTTQVFSVKETADGQHLMVAGGQLGLGTGLNAIARLNLDGSVDATFNASTAGLSGQVVTNVYPNADGSMLLVNGENILRLTSSGALDSSFVPSLVDSDFSFGPQQPDGKIFYTALGHVGNVMSRKLHRMNADGSDDSTFVTIATPYGSVYEIGFPIISDDGTIFVGPMTADRVTAGLELTHVLANGTIDTGFNPRFGTYGGVAAYVHQGDGKHLLFGSFSYVNNAAMPLQYNLIRLKDDGSLDSSFNAALPISTAQGNSFESEVTKMFLQPSGKILVFGLFPDGSGGLDTTWRLNADGTNDSSFQPLTQALNPAAMDNAGYIYAAAANGPQQLSRYTPDGVLDPTFQYSPTGGISMVTPLSDGTLLLRLSGNFNNYSLVRLLHSGTRDPGFVSFTGNASSILAMTALPDGNALLTEATIALSGADQDYYSVVRLLANGTSDYSYTSVVSPSTNPSTDILLAMAGALFDTLRQASPGASAAAAIDLTPNNGITELYGETDGQLMMRTFNQYGQVPLQRYLRTTLTSPSMDAAPAVIPSPVLSQIVPLNGYTFTNANMSGVGPFTYVWMKDGVPLSGHDSSQLFLQSMQSSDAGTYTVTATNAYGSATSPALSIFTVDTSHSLAAVTTQPANQTVNRGGTVTFSVVASGDAPLGFQWTHNDTPISAANNSSLTLNNVQLSDAGNYAVQVTNFVSEPNGGYGGFAQSQEAVLTVTIPPHSTNADFNGDGNSDLLWQDTLTGDRLLWLMNGTAPITALDLASIPTDWSIAAVGDFNGDGQPDLVWQNTVTGERLVWLMSGTTPVDAASLGTVSTDWLIAGAGDMNGDGKADLLWTNTVTGERTIWLMNGTTPGTTISLGIVPFQWALAGAADFNGDGQTDLLWDNTLTGEIRVWLMNGTTQSSVVSVGTVSPQLQVAGTGDYNADGQPDIVFTNRFTGERSVWLMNGTTHASTASLATIPLNWVLFHPVAHRVWADFNSDGKSDLIWQNTATGEALLYLMNGTTPFTAASVGTADPNLQIAATGDFNADGKADLVWQNLSTGDRYIWLMNGTTMASSVDLGVVSTDWSIIGTGDFNADGYSDLIWKNSVTGDYLIWLMNGTTPFNAIDLGVIDPNLQLVGTGDFNSDSSTDLLWQNTATGERLVWLMNGTMSSSVSLGVVSTDWSLSGTGDFNADGQTDLIWVNNVTGERVIWLMNGSVPFNGISLGIYPADWTIKN